MRRGVIEGEETVCSSQYIEPIEKKKGCHGIKIQGNSISYESPGWTFQFLFPVSSVHLCVF